MDHLVSIEEAARLLGGLSKYTIQAWLSQGKLKRTKVGARTMIRVSELERFVEAGGRDKSERLDPFLVNTDFRMSADIRCADSATCASCPLMRSAEA